MVLGRLARLSPESKSFNVQASIRQTLDVDFGTLKLAVAGVVTLKRIRTAKFALAESNWLSPNRLDRLMQFFSKAVCFPARQPFALAGSAVVLIVMRQTQKGQICDLIVVCILVQVSDLTLLDGCIPVQARTDAATSSAMPKS